jgi:hypothetical protein
VPDYLISTTIKVPEADRGEPKGDSTTTERLVRAKNEARAIAHVVADTVKVARASTDDVIRLSKAGVELEVAA